MKILITGGTGFVGERLINKLRSTGHQLRVISRNSIPGIETVVADLKEASIPSEALSGVDTVFHLAGIAHDFREAAKMRNIYYAINVDSTIQLAELAIQSDVKRFVFVSSVKAGGKAFSSKCMIETDQFEPEGIYGKSKRKAEIMLLELSHQSDMHIVIVRPSLVYGPGMKGNLKLMLSGIQKGWFPPLPNIDNHQ